MREQYESPIIGPPRVDVGAVVVVGGVIGTGGVGTINKLWQSNNETTMHINLLQHKTKYLSSGIVVHTFYMCLYSEVIN